ncbi:MAG: hypothetical protein V4577_13715 [Bacteroidota bacterium]
MENKEKIIMVELGPEEANLPLFETPYFHLGDKPEIEACSIKVFIAEEPQVIDYIALCNKQGVSISKEMELLQDRVDIWLINQSVGVSDQSNTCSIKEITYTVSYQQGARIEQLMPDTTYIKKNASGAVNFEADLDAQGGASTADLKIPVNEILEASAKAKISATVGAKVALRFSTPVLTPLIAAHGKYSKSGGWTVKRDDKNIAGDQLFSQIIFTEKNLKEVRFQARVSVVINRFGFLNSRREGVPVDIVCKLPL